MRLQRGFDPLECFEEGVFFDGEGRGEAEGAVSGLFGEDALFDELGPEGFGVDFGGDFDSDEEASSSDFFDVGEVHVLEKVEGFLAELGDALGDASGFELGEGGEGDGGSEGVTSEGAAVVAGDEDFHDVVFADGGADGEESSAEGFTDGHDVGFGVGFLHPGEFFAGAVEADLDFVPDEEGLGLVAEFADLGHPSGGGEEDSSLGLDGFGEDGDGIGGDGVAEGLDVAEGDGDESGGERPEVLFISGFGGESDDSGGASVEVVFEDDDFGLVFGDVFDGVAPFSGEFDGGLDGFGAGVHGADAVGFAEFGEGVEEESDFGVDEGAAGDGDMVELVSEGLDDVGGEVSVGDGGVGADAVDELVSLFVPDSGVFSFDDIDGQGAVVFGAEGHGEVFGVRVGEALDHFSESTFVDELPHGGGLGARHRFIVAVRGL